LVLTWQAIADGSTPIPLTFERFYQPDVIRVLDKLIETLSY